MGCCCSTDLPSDKLADDKGEKVPKSITAKTTTISTDADSSLSSSLGPKQVNIFEMYRSKPKAETPKTAPAAAKNGAGGLKGKKGFSDSPSKNGAETNQSPTISGAGNLNKPDVRKVDQKSDGSPVKPEPSMTTEDTPEERTAIGCNELETAVEYKVGTRVKLDPRAEIFRAKTNKSARLARKSHKRDESAAKPDKRRREAVHETIYRLGGFINVNGKRVYIEPGTPYKPKLSTPELDASDEDEEE